MRIDQSKYYIFYDGECGFCNHWVQWILKNDKKDRFLFSPLQGRLGQRFLAERNLDKRSFNTLYLWKPNDYYLVKFQAIKKIAKILGGKYGLLSRLWFLSDKISDRLYDQVAKNRQKLSLKECPMPTPEQRRKIIE